METIWWKTRVTSERMFEMMKFLRAYWGRDISSGRPREEGQGYPVSQVLLRALETAYADVTARLEKSAQYQAKDNQEARRHAAWWLKMAREGRNGDPFPGVSYPAAEPAVKRWRTGDPPVKGMMPKEEPVSDDPADPGTMSAIAAGRF